MESLKTTTKEYSNFISFVTSLHPEITETKEYKDHIEKIDKLENDRTEVKKKVKEEQKKISDRHEESKKQQEIERKEIENRYEEWINKVRSASQNIEENVKSMAERLKSMEESFEPFITDYESDEETDVEHDYKELESYSLCTDLVKKDLHEFLLSVKDKIESGELNEEKLNEFVFPSAKLMKDLVLYVDYCKSDSFTKQFKFKNMEVDELEGFIINELYELYASNDGSSYKIYDSKFADLFQKFISSAFHYFLVKYRCKKGIKKVFTVELLDDLFVDINVPTYNRRLRKVIQQLDDDSEDIDICYHFKYSNVWMSKDDTFALIKNIFCALFDGKKDEEKVEE
jgi:flagellar biosynthesis GTPase FlhF